MPAAKRQAPSQEKNVSGLIAWLVGSERRESGLIQLAGMMEDETQGRKSVPRLCLRGR